MSTIQPFICAEQISCATSDVLSYFNPSDVRKKILYEIISYSRVSSCWHQIREKEKKTFYVYQLMIRRFKSDETQKETRTDSNSKMSDFKYKYDILVNFSLFKFV